MTIADTKILTQAQTLSPDSASVARHAKLKDAAEQFEGMMMQELLKPMQGAGSVTGGGFDGDEKDTGDDAGDPAIAGYSSYGVEAMATALAKGGGLGIAKEVMRQIEHQIGKPDEKNREKASSTKV
jgi:flagellar protein FlgJ